VRQDAFIELPWDTLLGNFDAVFSAAYSVNVLTRWNEATVNRLWLKTRLTDGQPATVEVPHLGASPAPSTMISSSADDPTNRLNPFGVAGPWSERLPHFRFDRTPGVQEQIQSEYMVPRSRVVEALIALRAIGARIDPMLYATELRSMAADGLWLSPAHGHDSVGIHFTWKQLPADVDALTHEIESLLLPLGARPHWGKLLHAPADKLATLYSRMDDFRALANRYDPDGKFRNTYLTTHVFG
jgi:xylitol oxidase